MIKKRQQTSNSLVIVAIIAVVAIIFLVINTAEIKLFAGEKLGFTVKKDFLQGNIDKNFIGETFLVNKEDIFCENWFPPNKENRLTSPGGSGADCMFTLRDYSTPTIPLTVCCGDCNVCPNGACQCACDTGCGGGSGSGGGDPTHRVCSGTNCVTVSGSGTDQCSSGAQCSHSECVGGTCTIVAAYPDEANSCSPAGSCCGDGCDEPVNACPYCESVIVNGKEVTRCSLPTAEEIASRGGGPGRGNGPAELCGCFCSASAVWENDGDWYPGLGCLHGVYPLEGMTGDWGLTDNYSGAGWWTSSYQCDWMSGDCGPEENYPADAYYCDFFCGDGDANPGDMNTKEECDVGLSLDPSEGISGTDLRGYGCSDVAGSSYTEGSLGCDNNCNFDTSNCAILQVGGCTDTGACNYNSNADYDDGSCNYNDQCGVCDGDGSSCGCCGLPAADNYESSCNEPTTYGSGGYGYYDTDFCFYNNAYSGSYEPSIQYLRWPSTGWSSGGSCSDLGTEGGYTIPDNYESNHDWTWQGFGWWKVSGDMADWSDEYILRYTDEMCDFYCWACEYSGTTQTDTYGNTGVRYADKTGFGEQMPSPGQLRTYAGCKC